MKTIKVFLLLMAVLFFCNGSYAGITLTQDTIRFIYDDAGNRTNRTIVIATAPQMSSSSGEEEEEATSYSEILADLRINIYPNPTDGLIRVEIQNLPAGETAHISLYRLSGELVTTKRGVTSSTEIDITGQAAGIYLLKIIAGKEQTEWKIIKK
jgi:hypothetical protein